MRTVRLGAMIGVAVVGMGFGLAATDCASATTITIDVRTRAELCSNNEGGIVLRQTGIAVSSTTKYKDKDKSQFQITHPGCNPSTGSIGTLVITPSGSKTEKVGIRVVAGLNANSAEACDAEDPSKPDLNCIIALRQATFIEGQNVPISVLIDPDCNGVQCDDGRTCVKGACAKVEDVPTKPNEVPDANAIEDATGISDVEPPKPIDAGGPDGAACNLCSGSAAFVGCDAGTNTCIINCSAAGVSCRNGNALCPPGLNCVHQCNGNGDCDKANCGTANGNTCRFECGVEPSACTNIACDAGKCEFDCKGVTNACTDITMLGKTKSLMTCAAAPGDLPSCDRVTCLGPDCERTCEKDAGCGLISACDGGCTKFRQNDGGPPDAGEPPQP